MPSTSGAMIRDARVRAQLSQTDLAQRAGVAQSVISAYESDRRDPSLRTLTKLIQATGHRLAIDLVPTAGRQLGLPDTRLGRRLRQRRRAVVELAALRGARNVRVFGSVARGQDAPHSDVDLLVDLDDGVGLVALAALERELTDLLGAPVDVVPADTLKTQIRDEVLAESIPL
jgi:uncharacterized protein